MRRYLLFTLALATTLTLLGAAARAEDGKFVFRDGQWIYVPPESELPPRTGEAPTEQPAPATAERPSPEHTETPAPQPEPVKEPAETPREPAPESAATRTELPLPPPPTPAPPTDTTAPVEPVEVDVVKKPTPSPTPSEQTPTETATTATEPPAEPVKQPVAGPKTVAAPSVERPPLPEPAALDVPEVESVGAKYRDPAPSTAPEDVQPTIAAAKNAPEDQVGQINYAAEQFRAGNYRQVVKTCDKFFKTTRNSPLGEAAWWLKGEAIFVERDYYHAFVAYEDLVKNFAGSPLVEKALRREFECAEALLGPARRIVLGMPLGNGEDEGIAILEKVYGHRPTGPLAPDAIFRIGEYMMDHGRFEEAEDQFRKFTKEFPNNPRTRQAELLAAKTAMASDPGPQYDDAPLKRARDTLINYQEKYPQQASRENVPGALEKVRRAEAMKRFEMAAYYRRARRPRAAVYYARKVVQEYPDTPAANDALRLLNELGATTSDNPDTSDKGARQ